MPKGKSGKMAEGREEHSESTGLSAKPERTDDEFTAKACAFTVRVQTAISAGAAKHGARNIDIELAEKELESQAHAAQKHGTEAQAYQTLLDLFRAKLCVVGKELGGRQSAFEALQRHVYLDTAQQPYSLGALRMWVGCTLGDDSDASAAASVVACLHEWVVGPFSAPQSFEWISPLDEVLLKPGLEHDFKEWDAAPQGDSKLARVQNGIEVLKMTYDRNMDKLSLGAFVPKAGNLSTRLCEIAVEEMAQRRKRSQAQGNEVG